MKKSIFLFIVGLGIVSILSGCKECVTTTIPAHWSLSPSDGSGTTISAFDVDVTVDSTPYEDIEWTTYNNSSNAWQVSHWMIPADNNVPIVVSLYNDTDDPYLTFRFCHNPADISFNTTDGSSQLYDYGCRIVQYLEDFSSTCDDSSGSDSETRACVYTFKLDEVIPGETIIEEYAENPHEGFDTSVIPEQINIQGTVVIQQNQIFYSESEYEECYDWVDGARVD